MKSKILVLSGLAVLTIVSCTKLDTKLYSSIEFKASTADAASLLNGTYNDYNGLIDGEGQIFSLQENTSDEALVPTRGGDWDDNGVWRVMHLHTWTVIHDQTRGVFNALGKMEADALATLASNPTPVQSDEALFLLSVAQFHYLDLYGVVPYRTLDKYNAIDPAPVMQPDEAVQTLLDNLNGIITRNALPGSNVPYRASIDATKFLLMKLLLNKGAFLNRAAPTFDATDMQRVVTLGTEIAATGKYSLTPNYFDNFGPKNATTGKEAIWSWPNSGAATNNGINSMGINNRWMMTLHYNSWDAPGKYGGAGWNGFSTVSDFYNSFEGAGATSSDTTKDQRIGGRFYPGVTNQSGLRPGMVIGQQYNEAGVAITDRQGNPLAFTALVHNVEADPKTLETAGIRVIKYPPDYNAYDGGNQTNQLQIYRYADVVLMGAEALLRTNQAGLGLTAVNALRAARGASALATLTEANLLAERGRELYWESWRRQDLIRFGVYLQPWELKPTDDPKNLLFPIPPEQLVANPNLVQNPGY